MKLKRIVGVMLTLLLIGTSAMTFYVQSVTAWPKTIYVDDDNVAGPWDGTSEHPYQNITSGIEHAGLGDTIFVYSGVYCENVVIDKTVSLIGQNRTSTIIDGNNIGNSVTIWATNNVTISCFTIRNGSSSGIEIGEGSHGNLINDNIITLNLDFGIWMYKSNNNSILENIVVNNVLSLDGAGIRLWGAQDNKIAGNNVTNNGDDGIFVQQGSNGNNVTGNHVMNNLGGILLENSGDNRLRYNNMSGNKYNFGVYAHNLQQFINDIDTSNEVEQKPIYYLTNKTNLVINSSTFPDIGYLAIVNSTNIDVKGLELAGNFQGFTFAYTNNSRITNSTVTNNEYNIALSNSFDNNITDNNITNASAPQGIGIWSYYSGYNNIYHNNFINNTEQAYSHASLDNWDDGYPSGGNYWSDHKHVDGYTGPYQNETGQDGICDTPYKIYWRVIRVKDNYPLLGPKTANLVIQTFTLQQEEIEDVKTWIDGDTPTYYSTVNATVSQGVRNVRVLSNFNQGNYLYTFQYWNDSYHYSERNVTVSEDTTLIAYYAKTTGPGCPFVWVWNGTGFVIDNNLLPNSANSNGSEVEDYYKLEQSLVPIANWSNWSLYPILITEFQQEHSYLDQTQLITVDHDSDVNVAVSPFGEILTYQNPYAPLSAVDDQGYDWIETIQKTDEFYYEGHNGSYLLLNFGVVEAENAKLVMRVDRPPLKTSIHIQVLNSINNWVDVVAIIPRTYWATEIIDLSSYLSNSTEEFKVRLYFTGSHKVDFVGLDTTQQAQIDVQEASLILAYHSDYRNITPKLLTDDDVYAELTPGQQILLLFAAATQSREQRTFIIYVNGYYTTIDN